MHEEDIKLSEIYRSINRESKDVLVATYLHSCVLFYADGTYQFEGYSRSNYSRWCIEDGERLYFWHPTNEINNTYESKVHWPLLQHGKLINLLTNAIVSRELEGALLKTTDPDANHT